MGNSAVEPAYLIVNADDYAYFGCVSRGILECAAAGGVTATGVFANSPFLEEHAAWLAAQPRLDLGVHLNLSSRAPLSGRLAQRLASSGGAFPGKFAMAAAVLSGRIAVELIEEEWRAQIERCLAAGLELRFLNSHEHLHMLPRLFPLAVALAREYAIEHLRISSPERPRQLSAGALVRDAALAFLTLGVRKGPRRAAPHFLGMGISGRLSLDYLEQTLPRLKSGEVYELMCHPGLFDPREVRDAALLHYHAWELEHAALCAPEFADLLQRCNVRLIGYRQLRAAGSGLEVLDEERDGQ